MGDEFDEEFERNKANAKSHVTLAVPVEMAPEIIEAMTGARPGLTEGFFEETEPGKLVRLVGESGWALSGFREGDVCKIDFYLPVEFVPRLH